MLNLVKELCLLNGVSSGEDDVRDYLMERCRPYAASMRVDALGNLIVFKRGEKSTGSRLMLTAHMDEVGFIVNDITEDGYLKFAPVGGIDPRVVIGKRVSVGRGRIPGAIGLKAYHLVSAEEEKKVPETREQEKPKYGWIAPDGRYFQCDYGGHSHLATKIVGEMEAVLDAELHLEEHGWAKIFKPLPTRERYAVGMGTDQRLTDRQLATLKRLGLDSAYGVSCFL